MIHPPPSYEGRNGSLIEVNEHSPSCTMTYETIKICLLQQIHSYKKVAAHNITTKAQHSHGILTTINNYNANVKGLNMAGLTLPYIHYKTQFQSPKI